MLRGLKYMAQVAGFSAFLGLVLGGAYLASAVMETKSHQER